MSRFFPVILVLFFLTQLGAENQAQRQWLKQVSPLISEKEQGDYLTLKKKNDIALFETVFWMHRDPTPETEANEFKSLYESRWNRAMQKFGSLDTPQGLTFLIFGEPAATSEKNAAGKTLMSWHYERGPFFSTLHTPFDILFSAQGLERPSSSAAALAVMDHFKELVVFQPIYVNPKRLKSYVPNSKLPEDKIFIAALASGKLAAFPLVHEWTFSKTRVLGTYVNLVFSAPEKPGQGMLLALGRWSEQESGLQLTFKKKLTPFFRSNGELFYTLGRLLIPGSYELTATFFSDQETPLLLLQEKIGVDSFQASELIIGPVVLTSEFRQGSAAQPEHYSPYLAGNLAFKPNPAHAFSRSETLYLFFPLYNPSLKDGSVNLRVEYRIVGADRTIPLNPREIKQTLAENQTVAVSASFPLSSLPGPGIFRLEIEAADNNNNSRDKIVREFSLK